MFCFQPIAQRMRMDSLLYPPREQTALLSPCPNVVFSSHSNVLLSSLLFDLQPNSWLKLNIFCSSSLVLSVSPQPAGFVSCTFPQQPSSLPPVSRLPASSFPKPHSSISAMTANPCRCWRVAPFFPVLFLTSVCSMGWGLTRALLAGWQLRSGCHLTDQVVTKLPSVPDPSGQSVAALDRFDFSW